MGRPAVVVGDGVTTSDGALLERHAGTATSAVVIRGRAGSTPAP